MESKAVTVDAVTRETYVAAAAYSLETIKRAAYRFIDRFAVELVPDSAGCRCIFRFAAGTTASRADESVRDFHAELLDQDLRRIISTETKGLRDAILALAFAPTAPSGRE